MKSWAACIILCGAMSCAGCQSTDPGDGPKPPATQPYDRTDLAIHKLDGKPNTYYVVVSSGYDWTTLKSYFVVFDTGKLEALKTGSGHTFDKIAFTNSEFAVLREKNVCAVDAKVEPNKSHETRVDRRDDGETFDFKETDADWDQTSGALAKGTLWFRVSPAAAKTYETGKASIHIDFKERKKASR